MAAHPTHTLTGVLTAAVVGLSVGAAAAAVKIDRVWPEKLVYKPGATARIAVTLTNPGKASDRARLRVAVIRRLDTTDVVHDRVETVAAGKTRVVELSCPVREEYGYEVRAELLGPDGSPRQSASEYFAVVRNAYKIGNYYTLPLDSFGSDDYFTKHLVPALRKNYVVIMEWFSGMPCGLSRFAPETDEYFSGQSGYHESRETRKRLFAEMHKHGMTVVAYVLAAASGRSGTELARRHPEWFLYRANGQIRAEAVGMANLNLLDQFLRTVRASRPDVDLRKRIDRAKHGLLNHPFGLMLTGVNTLDFDLIKYATDRVIEGKEVMGYDGVRFDGHYIVSGTRDPDPLKKGRQAYDVLGRPAGAGDEAKNDELSLRNMKHFRETILEKYPDFIFGYNYGTVGNIVRWQGPRTQRYIIPDSYQLLEEINQITSPTYPAHRWEKFVEYIQRDREYTRRLGGYYYIGFFTSGNPIFNAHLVSLSAASQAHLACPWQDKRPWYQFLLRYSYYLYDLGLQPVDPGKTAELARVPDGIWWKHFVWQRKRKDGAETIVHLINPPVEPVATGKETKKPAVKRNVTVSLKVPAGMKPGRVFCLVPPVDTQLHRLGRKLPFTTRDGWVEFTVPELVWWNVLVAEWTR